MEQRIGTRLKDRPEFYNKPKPVTFLKNDKVIDAISVMAKNNFGSVVVTNEKFKVIGIVTERDIVKRLILKNLSDKTTTLEKIMTENPRVANENDNIIDWLRIMSNDRFRRLPVVDSDGKIKVIISNTKAQFVFPNSILTTKLNDGSFPDYQRVIPKENLNKLVVSNQEFSKAIDRVSTVSMEKSRAVKLSLGKNLLKFEL